MNILKSFASDNFVDTDISFIGKSKDGILGKEVFFPLSHEDCVEHILPFSYDAYFGKNDKAVLDPTYRRAQVIYPNLFFTNFDPNNYNIIDTIQTQMGEQADNIKFVRDKLNIYSKDGHFKVHKDTPRSPDMIGTLVICFPCEFVGGDFVLYTKQPTSFNFDKLSKTHFQWCAFYGDIDHEVKPVESGYRISITYLINKTKNITDANIGTKKLIENILNDPDILPKGGYLGYGCKYLYSSNSDDITLKGEDSIIYHSFSSLGLKPIIEQITFFKEKEEWNSKYSRCNFCKSMFKRNEKERGIDIVNYEYGNDEAMCLSCSRTVEGQKEIRSYKSYGSLFYTAPIKHKKIYATNVENMLKECGKRLVRNIYWVNSPYDGESVKAIESDILYGNDPTTHEEVYKRCAFLIYISNYDTRKKGIYQDEHMYSHIIETLNDDVTEEERVEDDNNDDDDITGITNTPEDSEEDEHTGKETRKTS